MWSFSGSTSGVVPIKRCISDLSPLLCSSWVPSSIHTLILSVNTHTHMRGKKMTFKGRNPTLHSAPHLKLVHCPYNTHEITQRFTVILQKIRCLKQLKMFYQAFLLVTKSHPVHPSPTPTQAISYSQVNTTIAQTVIHILSPTPNPPKDEKKKKSLKEILTNPRSSF